MISRFSSVAKGFTPVLLSSCPSVLLSFCSHVLVSYCPDTVSPVSHHWSGQSGESNLRAWISGHVKAGIRLRPVNSVYRARKKDNPRCAVKLSFSKLINSVPNILQKLLQGNNLHYKFYYWPFWMFLTI